MMQVIWFLLVFTLEKIEELKIFTFGYMLTFVDQFILTFSFIMDSCYIIGCVVHNGYWILYKGLIKENLNLKTEKRKEIVFHSSLLGSQVIQLQDTSSYKSKLLQEEKGKIHSIYNN